MRRTCVQNWCHKLLYHLWLMVVWWGPITKRRSFATPWTAARQAPLSLIIPEFAQFIYPAVASLVAQLVKNLPECRREKAMAPYSSTLAWKIPWTEETRRLQSVGSLRVGHDWATSVSLFTFMHWRRKKMTTHSSVLAWRIQGMGEPGGLPSMGLHRVGHYWSDLAVAAAVSFSNANDFVDLNKRTMNET